MQNQAVNFTAISEGLLQFQPLKQLKMFYVGFFFSQYQLKSYRQYIELFEIINKFYDSQPEKQGVISVMQQVAELHVQKYTLKQFENNFRTFMNRDTRKQDQISIQKPSFGLQMFISRMMMDICQICFELVDRSKDIVFLCTDAFHPQCIIKSVQESIDNFNIPVLCPNCQCNQPIPYEVVFQMIPSEYQTRYEKLNLHTLVSLNPSTMFWCPTVGCQHIFRFGSEDKTLVCPECHINYCLKCRTEFHQAITCEQNMKNIKVPEEDIKFVEFATRAKYKQCLRCKYWVEKNREGCNHILCRCGFEFCYMCGSNYQDNCECSDYSAEEEEGEIERMQSSLEGAEQLLRETVQTRRESQQQLHRLELVGIIQERQDTNRIGQRILARRCELLERDILNNSKNIKVEVNPQKQHEQQKQPQQQKTFTQVSTQCLPISSPTRKLFRPPETNSPKILPQSRPYIPTRLRTRVAFSSERNSNK